VIRVRARVPDLIVAAGDGPDRHDADPRDVDDAPLAAGSGATGSARVPVIAGGLLVLLECGALSAPHGAEHPRSGVPNSMTRRKGSDADRTTSAREC